MRKSLSYKILLSVLGITSLYVFYNPVTSAITYEGYTLNGKGAPITITDNKISINGQITDLAVNASVFGNHSQNSDANYNDVTINHSEISTVYGGFGLNANNNDVTLNNGSYAGYVNGGYSDSEKGETNGNTVIINKSTVENVYGGYSLHGSANNNIVIIDNSVVDDEYYDSAIIGGYAPQGKGATGNTVKIIGNSNIENASIYGGRSYSSNINVEDVITGNTLTLNGWRGSTKSVQNFNSINFDNINWQNDGTVLTITEGADNDLANTEIYLNSIAGGSKIAAGDTMTLIKSNKSINLGIKKDNIKVKDNFFAGVATEGTGTATINDDGSVDFKVDTLKANSQIDLVAENRAVASAFVNQGTDLISDSLDTISRDSNYSVKTFAAVHGNRSKYDVNSDIKINGWSVIAGVGNAGKFDNGSEFSWGVFYENGSGNNRTYNEFNNEFFRGDGSLVYNGGGIAARYTNKNGVYTEGSLRAGMLKSDMDNALRDGAGNFYGYESESAYYGAHIGIGKIISLSESSDLDVYGKFFHTYTEGDSFKVAGDEFEFDSINSDRLRIGARITSNKENKFSTYYGLAYEYEFNGDADMTAQGLKAPTQSLQGSSVMAEIGFNYQPTPDSPWSFDLNMRGYTGERQGGSFNVQATYTF